MDETNAELPANSEPINGISILANVTISEQEVTDQIKILNANKSYGHDKISPMFLKMSGLSLIKPLTRIFNLSLSQSIFPDLWKIANVLPLHKKGPKELLSNYRSVSLLCILGKIMERLVFKYVFNHFRDNFLISIWQSGFLPGSSTVTQLVELHYYFCKAVSEDKEIRIVFLDISKAFDRVWHNGLLFKLKRWGISGSLLEWFKSYLTDRYQRVVVNGQNSKLNKINSGVPQGSVLGPLLFLVFINDLTHVVKHCEIRLFADDTCLFIKINDRLVSGNLINEDLYAIENWSKKWLVSFSAPKTESMIIGYKSNLETHPILFLLNQPIITVKSHKHVGLWIDSNLWWHSHINSIALKASKRLNIISYFKFKLDRKTLEQMYLLFVRPIMEYAAVVWAGAHGSDLMKLDNIQVDAMRIVTGCTRRSNIANLYKECVCEGLHQRRDIHILKMIFKIQNNLAPQYLRNILPARIKDTVPYPVRNSKNFVKLNCRLKCFKQSFMPYGTELWNDLPLEIRNISTLSGFSKALKLRSIDPFKRKKQIYIHMVQDAQMLCILV